MASNTTIEWTDATWNPIRGCSIVSEGCRNCYAMRQAHRQSSGAYQGLTRLGAHGPTWTGDVRLVPEVIDHPLRVRKPHMIFVNSMSDLFHPGVQDEWIDHIFAVMRQAKHHQFQVLTKRPERMLAYLTTATHQGKAAESRVRAIAPPNTPRHWYHSTNWRWPLPNVWLGVSAEDQPTADQRIPLLLQTPAAVRWVSAEPLLGALDLERYLWPNVCTAKTHQAGVCRESRIDWLVVGGESGAGARPMHPEWVRTLRDQATRAGVPFFFKQWGAWARTKDLTAEQRDAAKHIVIFPDGHTEQSLRHGAGRVEGAAVSWLVGKKAAGNLLDGREWRQFPDVAMGGA